MTIDMTNNRVPYGLLTDEEKSALHEHEKAGGEFEAWLDVGGWLPSASPRYLDRVYRTVPLPEKTQDVIAWERLPAWVEWVAPYRDGAEVIPRGRLHLGMGKMALGEAW